MRIGEFALASGVPVKTLRFYDEIGLFRPAEKNALTGYREYRPQQLSELASILALRDLGLPLAGIKEALRRSSPARRRDLLEQVRRDLRRALDEKTRTLSWVEAELRRLDEASPGAAVVLRRRPPVRVASVRAKLGATEDMRELERELFSLVPERSRGKWRGTLWHQCAGGTGSIDAEHFVELIGAPPPRAALTIQVLPAITAACSFCRDDETASEAAFGAVRGWMAARRYELASTKREIYWPGLLEIQFPVVVDAG